MRRPTTTKTAPKKMSPNAASMNSVTPAPSALEKKASRGEREGTRAEGTSKRPAPR